METVQPWHELDQDARSQFFFAPTHHPVGYRYRPARAPPRTHTHTPPKRLTHNARMHSPHQSHSRHPSPQPAPHSAHGFTRLAHMRIRAGPIQQVPHGPLWPAPSHGPLRPAPHLLHSTRPAAARASSPLPHTARCGPLLISSTAHGPLRPAPHLLYRTRLTAALAFSPPYGPDRRACHSHTTAPHTTHRPATRTGSVLTRTYPRIT